MQWQQRCWHPNCQWQQHLKIMQPQTTVHIYKQFPHTALYHFEAICVFVFLNSKYSYDYGSTCMPGYGPPCTTFFSCKNRQAYKFLLWLHIKVSSFIGECPFKTNYGTKVIVSWDTGHNICIWRCNYSKFSNQSYLTIKHNYDLTAWNVVNNYFLLLQCCWQAQ